MVSTRSVEAPLAVVVGATGAQGGSVINHLLASNKGYRLRALTRDPTKASAQALVAKGVEAVKGNLSNPDEIKAALSGADYVFAVTDFWSTMNAQKEMSDGKLLIDTALAAGVKLFVWSGLDPVSKISGGRHTTVTHFDSKASITEYARASGIPLAVVKPGFYMTNLSTKMHPKKQECGTFLLRLPISQQAVLPLLHTEVDYGAYVRAAIESPYYGAGSEIECAPEYISIANICKVWAEETGLDIKFEEVSDNDYIKEVPRGGEELVDMMRYFEEFGYFAGKDLTSSNKGVEEHVKTWREFVKSVDWSTILV